MATKTFKIGLSDTDKANMAQDVYERLIDMCFDEYDSSKIYNEGDFVVYNDVLYKCKQDNTTGTWDSSKWETATFQDLVDDVEGAVDSVNGKANIIDLENGTLVVAKAQIAQQIANVGDDVGSTQDEPFILQATATDNGITSAETAPIAKHLEKQGNSVVVNQLIPDNKKTLSFTTSDTSRKSFAAGLSIPAGHKVLLIYTQSKTLTSAVRNTPVITDGGNDIYLSLSENYSLPKGIKYWLYTAVGTITELYYWCHTPSDDVDVEGSFIDLTQWGFSADEIADLTAHPENFFRYYQGSLAYNAGTLTTSNGRYLKTIGRQQWDEEWEVGSFYSNGNPNNGASEVRSKNYIRVNPNLTYYIKSSNVIVVFYDTNKNFIKSGYYSGNETIEIPANCLYIKFGTNSTYGTTYNHNITISLYYADGVDYDKYFAYEEHIYDTGTETLLSAGSVRDIKLPSGEITKNVTNLILDGTISNGWRVAGTYGTSTRFECTQIVGKGNGAIKSNLLIKGNIGVNDREGIDLHSSTGMLNVQILTSKLATADVNGFMTYLSNNNLQINYEIATPTTEQGTSFPENIDVDNYGSMLWLDTSNNSVTIPQGSQFFYPADYVEFLDSLYTRSKDGGDTADVTNIVVKSELSEYVKQVDVSNDVVDKAGLTYEIKKLYKTGKLITLSVRAINETGSTIGSAEALFGLPSGTYLSYAFSVVGTKGSDVNRFSISNTGNVSTLVTLSNNDTIQLFVSYIVD